MIGLVHLLNYNIWAGFDPLENDVAFPFAEPGRSLQTVAVDFHPSYFILPSFIFSFPAFTDLQVLRRTVFSTGWGV
ncbi:MAG: hypothetical protein WCN98_16580 [Verrucomicrobiaceae bacterium]